MADVFLFICQQVSLYDSTRGTVDVWFGVIVRNRSIDVLRRGLTATSLDEILGDLTREAAELTTEQMYESTFLAQHGDTEESLLYDEAHKAVHNAVMKLSPCRQRLIDLAFFRDLSHAQIPAETGIWIWNGQIAREAILGVDEAHAAVSEVRSLIGLSPLQK